MTYAQTIPWFLIPSARNNGNTVAIAFQVLVFMQLFDPKST